MVKGKKRDIIAIWIIKWIKDQVIRELQDLNKFIKMDKDKKTDVGKIIYKTIQFKDINKGIEIFKNKSNTGRIIVKF